MEVIKRNGCREVVSFDKILRRITRLCNGLNAVDPVRVAQRVVQGVHDGVQTTVLDVLAAETAASLSSHHPDYARLAGNIAVSNLHKMTTASVRSVFEYLADNVRAFAVEHLTTIDSHIDWSRDYGYDYFAFKTLERSYLLRDEKGETVIERPQVMLMRVALGIHYGSLDDVFETYDYMSNKAFTHATPTMFNSGTRYPHLASCFLLPIMSDSIEGIYETQKRCAIISKSAGGIGFSVSNVRAEGSRIHSTGGKSAGLLPMLRCFEATARYVDQGGGKRKGAFAAYLEPWHADVQVFLDMKKNHGAEEARARDLFYGLWIPDLFMRRVATNGLWTLFCPSKCPDLVDLCGSDFDTRYEEYELMSGYAAKTLSAQELWFAILDAQIETGTPYMLYKDACNLKSNQKHLGTIRSSNLCTEIVQYSSASEVAVCNLASLSLPFFVDRDEVDQLFFNHETLFRVTCVVTRNLNKVIDRSLYADEAAKRSNEQHRPIGIGVQGLADVFAMLHLSFEHPDAMTLNEDIFETIYLAATSTSCELARKHGRYSSFDGSPASQGILQFDMWDVRPKRVKEWTALKTNVVEHGLRNSLLVAPMPTASTAQILGNNECFEPFTSNIYVRRVLAGEFAIINKHLVKHLSELNLWNENVRTSIIAANGSVRDVTSIPDNVKQIYKTAWEMSMRTLVDMAAARAPFVDQSQSLNLFVAAPNHAKLSSMHFYSWRKGLKTGMYYLRTRAAADAVKVTIPVKKQQKQESDEECLACSA